MSVARGAPPAFEKWARLAQKYEPMGPPMPIDTLLAEAATVLRFVQQHWEPTRSSGQRDALPGLRNAPPRAALDKRVASEIDELIVAVRHASNLYVRELKGRKAFPHRSARVTLDLLAQLRPIAKALRPTWPPRGAAARSAQRSQLSRALEVGLQLVKKNSALFKVGSNQRIRRQIETVGEAAAQADAQASSIGKSLELRDRLIAALHERTAQVRVTARVVFRDHPTEVRKVTSVYERKRRANHRKRLADPIT